MYRTPDEYFHRCAFDRSRFSQDLETDLSVFVDLICEIGFKPNYEFAGSFDSRWGAIGKTGKNHRTEMCSLLGLTVTDGDLIGPSSRCIALRETQDFPMFFKTMCLRFQFPNCINKQHTTKGHIIAGVKFKPAKYILKLFMEGIRLRGNDFYLTANEAGNFIFNDIRVVAKGRQPSEVLKEILDFRETEESLEGGSFLIQHSREFLKYMELGNLLIENEHMFTLNLGEQQSINMIIEDDSFFDLNSDYCTAGSDGVSIRKEYAHSWQSWYGNTTENETDILITPEQALSDFSQQGREDETDNMSLHEIGDAGERIVYIAERKRVQYERPDKLALVKVVSHETDLGYDIQSINNDSTGSKRFIEVKTTKRIHLPSDSPWLTTFDISSNEWETARQFGDCYYIYRVFLTKNGYKIYVVKNPCKREEEGSITIVPLKYRVSLKKDSGSYLQEEI
ncbi:MAG: protein NO VEIN domain-containing protein [Ruminiclostridium sp.]